MTQGEIDENFTSPRKPGLVTGFTTDNNGMQWLFLDNPWWMFWGQSLLLEQGNEMADFLGPTVLFYPSAVKHGKFERAVTRLEKEFNMPGALPRLANDGMALRGH